VDQAAQTQEFSGRTAVTVVAAELAIVFVGATLPTPLYPLYRNAFGFSGVTLTLIYAVYVVGNLGALLFLGRASDQVGRRRASLPALALSILSTVLFVLARGTVWLFAARVVSGLANGIAAGTATAWLAELPSSGGKSRAARTATCANYAGLAVAPLISGLFATYLLWPLRLAYAIYIGVLILAVIAVAYTRETVSHPKRDLSEVSLRPRVGVPKGIRHQFVSPAVTGFVVFAVAGFYAALIPNLLAQSMDQKSPAVAGAVVCILFAAAALCVLATARLSSRAAMLGALILVVPSVWLLIAAQMARSLPILLVATLIGGISCGLGYRGSLETTNGIAPDARRGEVISSYLLAVYFGNSVPVIGIGFLSAATSAFIAHVCFAGVITVLAVVALGVGMTFGKEAQPAANSRRASRPPPLRGSKSKRA
jgi:MFS family permease